MDAISGLLDSTEVELEAEPTIEEALYLWKDSAADFADCLIGAHHRRLGCRATATFDVRAVKLPGFAAAQFDVD
jgi:predicted nucleic-acid-binding protein